MHPDNGQPSPNWGQQYQGLGYFQQPSEPPRGRGNLVVVIAIVALVVIVAAVVTIVLVNRDDDAPQAQQDPPTSTSTPATRTTAPKSPRDDLEPRNAGWSVIKNEQASLIYEVPPSWTPVPGGEVTSTTMPGVVLSFPATLQSYTCEGKQYARGGLGGGTVAGSDPAKTATDMAKALGEEFYSSATPTVQVTAPVKVTIDGPDGKVEGVQADAVVTTTGNACMASKGTVSVLVFDSPSKNSFLVVNTDSTGGPASPPPPDAAETRKIIKSARMY